MDNQKLQLLESRFWEANESGGHPDEIERGWRHHHSRQDYDYGSRTSHPYSTRNIDRTGHRNPSKAGTDSIAEIERLKAREAELDAELLLKVESFNQHLSWLQEIVKDDPDAKKSFIVNPSKLDQKNIPDIKFISVENDIAPDLARAMIFKGL